ncbi:MAG: site-specific integrase [Candidatus Cloacimonadota bacterium]|nr:site-specific integrase [Candidatus Cloacimonadota bacterium]
MAVWSSDSISIRAPRENKEGSSYKVFSKKQLQEFVEVQTWLKTIGKSSVNLYLNALKKFCEFSGKNPRELILMRDKETRNPDPNNRTGVRDLIFDFRRYLEMENYAPKTINSLDGAVRSFFTAVLGREGMVNVKNYRNRQVTIKKDLVPTLEELKKMLDVCNLEEKFRIIFLAQTGMRVSDVLDLKVGDIERELEQEKVPLAVTYLPGKDRENIGERTTFLASDGVILLKQYLEWRKKKGETITSDSYLFVSRSKKYGGKGSKRLERWQMNQTVKTVAVKAGIGNGNGKYGRMRIHCLRKFFATQLTNHGIEDRIVDFFLCHKIPEVDRVYWIRRVEELRDIYRVREKYLNPLTGVQTRKDIEEMKRLKERVEKLEKLVSKLQKMQSIGKRKHDAKIVTSKDEIIEFAQQGYFCQLIGENQWLLTK